MKIYEQAADWATGVGIRAATIILPLISDKMLTRLLRFAERLAYAFSANEELAASIAEVADLFESGPRYNVVPRRVIASMRTDSKLAVSTLACLRKASPYSGD